MHVCQWIHNNEKNISYFNPLNQIVRPLKVIVTLFYLHIMHLVYIRGSIIYCSRQHDVLEKECVRVQKLGEDFPSPLSSRDTCGLVKVAHKSDHLTAFLYMREHVWPQAGIDAPTIPPVRNQTHVQFQPQRTSIILKLFPFVHCPK